MKKFEMVNESYSLVYEIKDFRRFSVRVYATESLVIDTVDVTK